MGENGETMLAADRASGIPVDHRDECCGMPARSKCIFDKEALDRPLLGALGPELALFCDIFPDDARALRVLGRLTVQRARERDSGGSTKGVSMARSAVQSRLAGMAVAAHSVSDVE